MNIEPIAEEFAPEPDYLEDLAYVSQAAASLFIKGQATVQDLTRQIGNLNALDIQVEEERIEEIRIANLKADTRLLHNKTLRDDLIRARASYTSRPIVSEIRPAQRAIPAPKRMKVLGFVGL